MSSILNGILNRARDRVLTSEQQQARVREIRFLEITKLVSLILGVTCLICGILNPTAYNLYGLALNVILSKDLHQFAENFLAVFDDADIEIGTKSNTKLFDRQAFKNTLIIGPIYRVVTSFLN